MACYYSNLTASALVKEGAGKVRGIFVASASATPTIKLWDSMSGAAPVLVNTFTPVGATSYLFPEEGVSFTRGLFITIGGTVDCTVFYE
jgi:hypothetical protein